MSNNFSEYINIPYKNLGRDKAGTDCFGLYWLIMLEKKGIEIEDYTDLLYDKYWYKDGKSNHIVDNISIKWIEVDPPYKMCDALLFYSKSGAIVNHIGIYERDEKFIHISSNYSSMISRLNDHWKRRLYKALRYKDDV